MGGLRLSPGFDVVENHTYYLTYTESTFLMKGLRKVRL